MKQKIAMNTNIITRTLTVFLLIVFFLDPICLAANNTRPSAFEPHQIGNYTYTQNFTQNAATQLKGSVSQVGRGKTLKAFIQNSVSTVDSANGDPIVAVLSENWVENGLLIAEAGSVISGTITSVDSAGHWSKDGALQIEFNKMETPAGEIYALNTEKINIEVDQEQKRWVKTAITIGGAALAAAAIGCLFGLGGSSSETIGHNVLKGAAIGGGIGAIGGVVAAGNKQGEEITIPANTNFEIKLLDNIQLQAQ